MNKLGRHLFLACCLIVLASHSFFHVTTGSPRSDGPPVIHVLAKTIAQVRKIEVEDTSPLIEEFSFIIKDFKINHQSEMNILNIIIRYRYIANIPDAEYPDFRIIAKDIEDLLSNYPNKKDYWEVINKKITLMVIDKHPTITRIVSEMQVSPSPNDPYSRSSIVTRNRPRPKIKR